MRLNEIQVQWYGYSVRDKFSALVVMRLNEGSFSGRDIREQWKYGSSKEVPGSVHMPVCPLLLHNPLHIVGHRALDFWLEI